MKRYPLSISISEQSANEYEDMLPSLISAVDKRMTVRQEELDLIGANPLSVMYDNHENHANLLVTVLRFNDFQLLNNILPWVLSNYTAKGFSPLYFAEVLDQWEKAIAQHLSSKAAEEIIPVYEWMEEVCPSIMEELASGTIQPPNIQEVLSTAKSRDIQDFVDLILTGNHGGAHRFVQERATDQESLKEIYSELIRPAMYEIGRQWERNTITVAHEHLATSIITRIITYYYIDLVHTEVTKGKAVVTASANEYHELGARIVADYLEMDGWDITYLGANTPIEELLSMLENQQPDLLCISVTMAFNFLRVRNLIRKARELPQLQSTKIVVGGLAFIYSDTISDKLGADALAMSASECVKLADAWWREKTHA